MKSTYFIVIVLVSGFTAGIIHGAVNLVIVEPYLDQAISIENQNLFATGLAEDTPQFWAEYSSYRDWQKSGQILAGGILGMSIGALFGIVFAYSRNALPKGHTVKKTFVLAAIMWFTIFLIPFLKYPANPRQLERQRRLYSDQYFILHLSQFRVFQPLAFLFCTKNLKIKNILHLLVMQFLSRLSFS